MLPVFFLPGALTGFFAFPFGRDQPTEIWALAKIRFLVKPRRRIWDQSGVKELVTITAPKRVEVHYTNGLTQTEVKSRLKALADTIDTRGWAVKNVTGGIYTQPSASGLSNDERLVAVETLPQTSPTADDGGDNDMLSDQNNPVASTFDRMMQQSDQARRNQVIESMQTQTITPAQPYVTDMSGPLLPQPQSQPFTRSQPAPQAAQPTTAANNNYWFMSQTPAMPSTPTQIVSPNTITPMSMMGIAAPATETEAEKNLAEQLREQNNSQGLSYAHLHTILPLSEQQALAQRAEQAAAAAKAAQTPVTPPPDPAIIALASNNDLNVATIARQANKQSQEPDEVVISLH